MEVVFFAVVLLLGYPAGISIVLLYGARRPVAGLCFHCGYSLDGLTIGSPCPECGRDPKQVLGPRGMPKRLAFGVLGAAFLIDAAMLASLWNEAKEGMWIGLFASTITMGLMTLTALLTSLRIRPMRGWPLLIPVLAAAIANAWFWHDDLRGQGDFRGISLLLAPIFTIVCGGALFFMCAIVVAVWNRRPVAADQQ